MRYLSLLSVLALRPTLGYTTATLAPTIVSRAEDLKEDPSLDNFRRRFDAGVTLLGDYIYIVGGHIARTVGDDNKVQAIEATLALDITSDWEPATVELKSFANESGPPTVWGHGLWADEKEDQVLIWGGSDVAPGDEGARTRKLWVLNPDNSGGGDWTTADAGSGIRRTARGGYVTCGGKGYLLGGWGTNGTDLEAFDSSEGRSVPGLITYDFEDKVWRNESKNFWTDDGSWMRGEAVCVELPDRTPKVFFLGGLISMDESKQLDFNIVHYWDPEQDEWFEQETVGRAPEPRLDSCAVGVSGPNGTYEIFLYSGWGGTFSDGSVLDDVWVLSIPAFRWFNVSPDRAQARYSHQCVQIGSQMVIIGGGNKRKWWESTDSFDRGLGVLDLNTISWKSGFEAKSDEYEGPAPVREWYDKNGYGTAIWSSDEAKKAFSHPDDGESSPSPTPSSDGDSSSSSSNTAAIAGGTVGGVAGLAIIGFLAWFLIRRRRKASASQGPMQHEHYAAVPTAGSPMPPKYESPAMGRATPAQELGGTYPQEMGGTYPQQLGGTGRQEMDGTGRPRPLELP